MGRSRRGGVPTILPPPVDGGRQLGLALDDERPWRNDVLPDVVHIAGWLDADQQRDLVADVPRLGPAAGRPPPPPRAVGPPDERAIGVPRLALAALRLHADGGRHGRSAGEAAAVRDRRARPGGRGRDVRRRTRPPATRPDAAIVNLYAPGARLGLHQDGEEPSAAPVVTISLGDTLHVPARRRRAPHRPVHRRRAALRRPPRLRRRQPAHLPRRAEGPRRHRLRMGSDCRRAGSASPSGRPGCDGDLTPRRPSRLTSCGRAPVRGGRRRSTARS